MNENLPALTMRGVRKTFEAENAPVRALRGVDLTVAAGEFVALMGPSGCGKSTLLNLVAGLELADEGTITVADEQVTGRGEDDLARLRRKHIGIIFQFFNLLEGMTVLENVALPAVIAGRKRKMAETRARDLLDLLGIGDKAAAVPGVLSGGQRQRLAIARALANEPTLLLADEPTGALDSDGGQEVIELLSLLHGGGQTIILVTHDAQVAGAAQRIVRMLDGRILPPDAQGEPGRGRSPRSRPASRESVGRAPGVVPVPGHAPSSAGRLCSPGRPGRPDRRDRHGLDDRRPAHRLLLPRLPGQHAAIQPHPAAELQHQPRGNLKPRLYRATRTLLTQIRPFRTCRAMATADAYNAAAAHAARRVRPGPVHPGAA